MLTETIISPQKLENCYSTSLYAILDACDSPDIQENVQGSTARDFGCLYRGETDPEILAEAPYLASVDKNLFTWIVETVWSTPWGIFLLANAEPKVIKKHLRKFLIVRDPEGDLVYFRYYDPRLLPTFLASCSPGELEAFFGPIYAFGIGIPKTQEIHLFVKST